MYRTLMVQFTRILANCVMQEDVQPIKYMNYINKESVFVNNLEQHLEVQQQCTSLCYYKLRCYKL
jgi:hypothetical protein